MSKYTSRKRKTKNGGKSGAKIGQKKILEITHNIYIYIYIFYLTPYARIDNGKDA